MKGIHIQLDNIIQFIDSTLPKQQTQQYECYILNLQKITLETFAIMNIILVNAPDEVPPQVRFTFEKTVKKFKQYFSNRPGLFNQKQDHHSIQFDEVKYFLQNRIDMTKNDDKQRGQLYKFLNQSEQKEQQNQILLSNIPKYSYGSKGASIVPTRNTKTLIEAINQPLVMKESKQIQTYADQFVDKGGLRNVSNKFTYFGQRNESGSEVLHMSDGEAQTDVNIQSLKQLIQSYSKQILKGKSDDETVGAIQQVLVCLKSSTENALRMKNAQGKAKMKSKKNKNIQSRLDEETQVHISSIANIDGVKEKKKKGNQKMKHHNSVTAKISEKSLAVSKQQITRTINQIGKTEQSSTKIKQLQRSSISKYISPSNKLESTKTPKQSQFQSKHLKSQQSQVKEQNEQNRKSTIINNTVNDNQDAESIISEGPPKKMSLKEKKSHQTNIKQNKLKQKSSLRPLNHLKADQYSNYDSKIKTEEGEDGTQENKSVRNTDDYRLSQLQQLQEDKKINWSNQIFPFNQINANQSQDITRSEANKLSNTIYLPSLQKQKIGPGTDNYSIANLNKSKENLHKAEDLASLGHKNLSHQSLYMRQSQNINSSRFANLWHNSKHENNCQSNYYKLPHLANDQLSISKHQYENMSQEEKKQFLDHQNKRLLNQIKEGTGQKRSKGVEWIRLIRNIRQYESLHTRICGDNCIHLKKFTDFLKRHNLSQYSNRKLLQVHKKNIQISPTFQE